MAVVSEFLKQAWFMENLEQECIKCTQCVHGVPQQTNFDPSADVVALEKAMTAKGVDEATIIDIMTTRTNAQRQQVKAAYHKAKGKSLEEAMKRVLKSHLEDVVVALLKTPAQFDAEELRACMKADRCENPHVNDELAEKDARALYEAGEQKKGTDINVFVTVLTARSYPHLRRVFQKYTKYSKHDMNKAVDMEMKGDIEKCLTALVKCATSKPAFFAEKLHMAMKGFGTQHRDLIRIMVSRHEVDMNEIKGYYKKMYGISLCQAIMNIVLSSSCAGAEKKYIGRRVEMTTLRPLWEMVGATAYWLLTLEQLNTQASSQLTDCSSNIHCSWEIENGPFGASSVDGMDGVDGIVVAPPIYLQKCTQCVHGVPQQTNFDPSADVVALEKAMTAKGVDEATIIDIMTTRTNAQRQQIKAAYHKAKGKSLEEAMKRVLKSHLEDVVVALLKTPAQFDAEELRACMKADRCENPHVNDELAEKDARALYEAGEQKKGTDINVFVTVLTARSYPHLRRVFQKYTKYSKHDMNKAVDMEMKGDIEKCLTALVKCATSKPAFFAEKLHMAMKGFGTQHRDLIRIMVSRHEVDMNEIKGYYKKMYGISLCQAIMQLNTQASSLLTDCSSNIHCSWEIENGPFGASSVDGMDGVDGIVVAPAIYLQKCTQCVHGVPQQTNFDPSADVVALEKAMTAKGVDEATIIDIMTTRTNAQRQQIKAAYHKAKGKSLEEAMKRVLKSHLEDVVVALLKTPAQFDAEELRACMKADRCENPHVNDELAEKDARALYEAGEQKKGTDINVFVTVLTARSYPHLRRVFQKYTKYSKHDMNKAVDMEMKGDIEKCLTALVKCATSKPAFFAEKLHMAMKGFGTQHRDLIRIMVSRHEVDMNEIKGYYKKMYGISLCQAIMNIILSSSCAGAEKKYIGRRVEMTTLRPLWEMVGATAYWLLTLEDELKGDYETILVALCGSDN
ncbi:hypothetical protein Q9966_011927 [Columba livia]|nr:hypothetical protein Q9966_011927 [Columba livia]